MHCNAFLIAGVLISAAALSPSAAPSAYPFETSGAWRGTETVARREPAGAADVTWDVTGGWGRVDSRVYRPGTTLPAVHRAALVWSALAATLRAGDAIPLSASAVLLEASGLDADCRVELVAWQGEPADCDGIPAGAVHLTRAALRPDDAPGSIADGNAAWRVPSPADPTAPSSALHVRAVMTHRGNTLTLTRSFAWVADTMLPNAAD